MDSRTPVSFSGLWSITTLTYFCVEIVPGLASRSRLKLAPVSFGHDPSFLSTSLLSGTVRFSRLILHFPFPDCDTSHCSQEPWYLLGRGVVMRNQDLGQVFSLLLGCHCSWVPLVNRARERVWLCVRLYVRLHKHTYTPALYLSIICLSVLKNHEFTMITSNIHQRHRVHPSFLLFNVIPFSDDKSWLPLSWCVYLLGQCPGRWAVVSSCVYTHTVLSHRSVGYSAWASPLACRHRCLLCTAPRVNWNVHEWKGKNLDF